MPQRPYEHCIASASRPGRLYAALAHILVTSYHIGRLRLVYPDPYDSASYARPHISWSTIQRRNNLPSLIPGRKACYAMTSIVHPGRANENRCDKHRCPPFPGCLFLYLASDAEGWSLMQYLVIKMERGVCCLQERPRRLQMFSCENARAASRWAPSSTHGRLLDRFV